MDGMSDDDEISYDPYGDTDPNNVPDGGFGQDTSAGDGPPGVPVEGMPGLRAGVFGAGNGLLGMARVEDLVARPGDARLMLASDPRSSGLGSWSKADPYPMPSAYMSDGHGGVQLRPEFAATHPKGPTDFGAMAHNIDWGGTAWDLAKIAASAGASMASPFVPKFLGWGAAPAEAVGPAGTGALPNPWMTGGTLAWRGGRTLYKQHKANPRNADPVVKPVVDKASGGLP
jgi:hypothetical protein